VTSVPLRIPAGPSRARTKLKEGGGSVKEQWERGGGDSLVPLEPRVDEEESS
jgi:hypothetical protein